MTENINKWLILSRLNDPNRIVFLSFTLFFLDSIVNYFYPVPLFVSFSPVLIGILGLNMLRVKQSKTLLWAFLASITLSGLIHTLNKGFVLSNFTDWLFLTLFALSWVYYYHERHLLSGKLMHIIFGLSLFLFLPSLVGIESDSWLRTDTYAKDVSPEPRVKRLYSDLKEIEHFRVYRQGFFRLPHLAAYFWCFLAIGYAFMIAARKYWLYLAALLTAMVFLILSGSRTAIIAPLIALGLYYFYRGRYMFVGGGIIVILLILLYRYALLDISKGTVFYQYFALIVTSTDNFAHLSRSMLWESWWLEMNSFCWHDYLIGRSYASSFQANALNLHYRTWFHNDFLSIIYSYGLISFLLYTFFFIRLFHKHKGELSRSLFLFMYLFTMVLAAFFNGFYYYFPILLVPIFMRMLFTSEALTSSLANEPDSDIDRSS